MTPQIQQLLDLYKVDNSRAVTDKLAEALQIAVEALEKMRNQNSDINGTAKYALAKIQAIAEGKE